jgi:hypothetical protein
MKTRNIIALLVALPLMAGLTGCKSDDELTAKPAKEMLRVLGGDIEIRAIDETTVVNVSADCHWKVQDLDTGDFGITLSIQPREGDGDGSLVIGTDQNETKSDRTASFTLVSDAGLKQKVTIRQTPAAGALNLSSTSFTFTADKKSIKDESKEFETLNIRGNSTWTIKLPDGVNWLHVSKTSGGTAAQSSESVNISVDNAVSDASRTAVFEVISEGNVVEVQVTQEGVKDIFLRAPEQLDKIEYRGGERMLRIESNAEWHAYIPSSVNWLHFEAAMDSTGTSHGSGNSISGVGNGEIRLYCEENNTTRDRLTAVVVIAGTKNPQQAITLIEQAANGSAQPLQTSISLSELSVARQSANFLINIASEQVVGEFGLVYTESGNVPTVTNGKVVKVGNGGTSRGLAYELTGLQENTRYMVRAFVYKQNSSDVIYSEPIEITTKASMLSIGELKSLYVSNTSAELRFSFTSDTDVIDYGFVYSATKPEPTRDDGILTIGRGGTGGNVMGTITNLQESTTYYVRAYVLTERGHMYGPNVVTITTSASQHEPGESDNPDPQLAPKH